MEDIKNVAVKMIYKCNPHASEGRIPYTYHHDMIRSECSTGIQLSRADVAQACRNSSEEELYSLAFYYVFCNMSQCDIIELEPEDILVVKELVAIARAHLKQLKMRGVYV